MPAKKSPIARQAAVLALAKGESCQEAAVAAGCTDRTITNWLGEPGFRAEIESIRTRLFEAALGVLITASTGAAVRLRRLVKSDSERIALSASKTVLESALALRAGVTLAAELRELKERMDNLDRPNQEGAA